jgi:hypothetical protein
MPQLIAVGFKTRLVEGMLPDVSTLTPPSNYKSDDAIAKWKTEQAEKIKQEGLMQPYSATFDSVTIHAKGDTCSWDYRDQSKANAKQPAPLAIWAWLRKRFPDAWPNSTHPKWVNGSPPAIFVGFDTRLFVKIMGIECSKPANQPKNTDGSPKFDSQAALPLSLWYSNSEHRDIEKAVMPEGFKFVTWPMVLKHYDLAEQFRDWKGPHQDPVDDAALTLKLADYLGMLAET